MLIGVLVVIAVAAVVASHRLQTPYGVPSTKLGWMSAQWLAEYRASHASETC